MPIEKQNKDLWEKVFRNRNGNYSGCFVSKLEIFGDDFQRITTSSQETRATIKGPEENKFIISGESFFARQGTLKLWSKKEALKLRQSIAALWPTRTTKHSDPTHIQLD